MKHIDVDNSRQPAFIVRADAAEQHAKFWPTFPKTKQDLALKVKEIATIGYFRSRVYLNAREGFIAVKVEKPQLADALQQMPEMNQLKQLVADNGIEMVSTNKSLLFRIK